MYEYQIMLFRLTNILATFQELINYMLYNHLNKFIIAYLNDILIFSKTEKEHEKHIKKVLKRLQEKNFYLKSKKCEFHKQQVEYLEHIIITEKLEMNSEKIKTVIKFLMSECIKDIQTFQKLTEYYQKFITNFISIIMLLIDLLKKNKSFK